MTSISTHLPSTHSGSRLQLRPIAVSVTMACVAMGAPPVFAETGQTETAMVALQTVVVSGARHEQLRDNLPMSIDVLSASEMEDAQMIDIHDLAKSLPNVSVKRAPARFTVTGAGNATGRDGNSGFNVRGQDGNRVLMLVDGVRLPRSYINGNNAFGRDALSLGLIKRVELVRGPASVLYGSDAMAGLVNFITLDPSDFLPVSKEGEPALGGRVGISSTGDDHGRHLAATLAGRSNEVAQWLLTGTGNQSHGMANRGSRDVANVDRTTPNPQTDRGGSVLGKVVLTPNAVQKHMLTLEHVQKRQDFELFSSRAKAPLVAASVVDERSHKDMARNRLSWDARYRLDAPWADKLQTVLSLQNTHTQDNGTTRRNDVGVRVRDTAYTERAIQLSLQAQKKSALGSQWEQNLIYGLDYVRTDIRSWFDGRDPAPLPVYVPKKYFPDTRDSSVAVYAQSELQHHEWRITPGLRLEHFSLHVLSQAGFSPPAPQPGKSISGSKLAPKLGSLYQIDPQWSVFGNYATGFRAPNAAQVNGFVENPTPTTFVTLLANPDLKPETSQNIELGLRGRMEHLQLDAAVFAGNYKQLIIDKKPLGGTGIVNDPLIFQTVNVDRARIQGFEIKGVLEWGHWGQGTLSSPFAYGLTRGWDMGTGRPLNTIDPAKLVAGIKYETAFWDLRLDAIHHAAKKASDLDSPYLAKPATPPRVNQFTTPSATTLDLYAQWRPAKNVRLNLALVNLSNRKYWMWSDVQGLASTSAVVDAYTQAGRHLNLSLIADF